MSYGPSYLSLNIHDFIDVNFQNLLKRHKAGKFSHSAHVFVQVKSHEPFPSLLTGYRLLRAGMAGFPKPAKAPPRVVLCAVQRDNSSPPATEGQHEFTPFLSLGFTSVFDFSCRIQSSSYPNFGMKKHCSP